MTMNAAEAKQKISDIFSAVLQNEPRYWYKNTWIRWGFMERDIYAIIDELVVAEEKR